MAVVGHDLYERDPVLARAVLRYLVKSGGPVSWDQVADRLSSRYEVETVERAVYYLMDFGAVYRMTAGRRGKQHWRLKVTPLGVAWMRGDVLPWLFDVRDDV